MNQLINRSILAGERSSFSCLVRGFRVSSQNMVISLQYLLSDNLVFRSEDSLSDDISSCNKSFLAGFLQILHHVLLFEAFRCKLCPLRKIPNDTVLVGDKLPSVDLFEDSPMNKVNLAKIASGKKIIVFAVPGAFTPGCSKTHLPGYLQKAQELKSKGVAEIFCVAVNDPFVMAAWGKEHGAEGKVRMLADPKGEFTDALELSVDLPVLGGKRSKRYSMLLEDGVVKELNVEPDNTGLSCSLVENIKL